MSKYSTSAPTGSASILTSDSEYDDYTENLELPSSPMGEKANAVTSETFTINPPQTPPLPEPPTQSLNAYTSQNISTRNSKQTFFSLFKKKEFMPTNRPMSAPPQQRVVPATVSSYNNKNTTEEIITESNNHFATDHNVSQSVIGSVSVPNLIASNTGTSLEAEYDALMKQKLASGFVVNCPDGPYGLGSGIAGGKPLNNHSKKSGKRKDSLVSIDKNDDKGFKNTMKNTMRKTSTFFKKLSNKPNGDNPSQQSGRLPLPDFQDISNSQSSSSDLFQNPTSSAKNSTEHPNTELYLDTNDDTTLSENDYDNGPDDEQEFIQRTFKDFASVYVNLQSNGENRQRAGIYRMPLQGANKSVPDNIGRTYEWNGNTENNTNENVQLIYKDSKLEFADTKFMMSEKKAQVPEEISAGLEQVEEVVSEDIYTKQNSGIKFITKVNPNILKSNEELTHSSCKEEVITSDQRSLNVNADQKGLAMKPKMGVESNIDSGLSPCTIPKRPDKKLPDVPKIIPISESNVSSSPRMRQTSSIASYETASGSTSTLHTAPHSPITDIFIETNNVTDGTPKIQVDDDLVLAENSIDRDFDDFPPNVPEKDEDEILWAEARIAAKRCFDEDETFIKKESITEFLGGQALKFYMGYFDFSNLRLDVAFRGLCEKLYIKGETQQVDRILESFSIKYWECNPKTIYGSADIVHAVAYSILLLNTDLHVAQVTSKMSRSQFVRNTIAAIHHAQACTAAQNSNEDDQSTITSETTVTSSTTRPRRSGSIKSWRSNPNSNLTNTSFILGRHWDSEVEVLLKEMYSAIKSNQILQPLTSSLDKVNPSVEQSNSLTPGLHRSMSHWVHPNSRINALKKGRSAGNVKGRKNINGRISPSPSVVSGGSDSSIGLDSLNRSGSSQTLSTTLSSFSLRHASSSETGFNSTIPEMVDEHDPDDYDGDSIADSISTTESLELYLSGAPYAKEGLLSRKHYWEATSKRAKDKGWKECFVVIEKGDIKMYKFENSSSHSSIGMGAIGGGNWMANATLMGEVNLRHTITNALPPPGYNRSRPHVFALSMSNGGLYFFQAGTAELVDEWVTTCNYWASRMSKEPLTGGVSSMEYGWGRCLEPILDGGEDWEDGRSIMSDGRSVMSSNSTYTSDRIVVSEWKIPLPPTVSSNFDEDTQLAALKKYRIDLENELEEHKNFWEPMTKLFHPKSSNYSKAFSNWEKKSQWLLYEIVKYTTYIECINNSIKLPINANEEKKEEEKRAELRAKARQSIKLLHRATWTPGDGFSLNLPKELLFGEALSDLDDEEDNNKHDENVVSENTLKKLNGKMKSSTYPPLHDNKKVIIEEETKNWKF
ncbi:11115_t:CDS:10 [Funneliformis geosporum]|uniref:18657_t:CDS:1 n=1 Tax=Funneliformis geosporum TaxID=1117311 RepID=A0A9W4SHC5_9GLOM|nr:18657_t:CDS:10 [Funneliformis geosporum]CAI2190333.1 11115_t:CDS:10 [Funneliformis geosporum]